MNLQFRATRPKDLDQCLMLLMDRFLYDPCALGDLRAMWLDVLSRDIARSSVVFEDGHPLRIVAFGISVAIEDSRFEKIRSGRATFAGLGVLTDWRVGGVPFLSETRLASANAADGVSILVTHVGMIETNDATLRVSMLSTIAEAFAFAHAGLNMKAFVHETFGMPSDFAVGIGFRTDFASHDGVIAALPPDRKPCISSMTRAEARMQVGNLALYQMFVRQSAARLELTAIQRRQLRFALEGESDEALAEILMIAPATLKKRWSSIYEAMDRVIGGVGSKDGHRGPEARRHVLRYIRQHPEELHPYRSSKQRSSQGDPGGRATTLTQKGRGSTVNSARAMSIAERETLQSSHDDSN